jgi:hypothetical protein
VTEDREWYVVAKDDPDEGQQGHTYVFGPFVIGGETDARAYALDLENDDDGWGAIEVVEVAHSAAQVISTDGRVMWPYSEGEPD